DVLEAVDDSGLERMVDLGKGHDLRDCAPCLGRRLQDLGALDAQLEALKILDIADLPGGPHDMEAVVPIGEALDAFRLELGEHLLGKVAACKGLERSLV